MPSKVILIVIEFMVLGLAARAKMSLSRAQNVFMPANIKSIVIFYSGETSANLSQQTSTNFGLVHAESSPVI